MKRILCSIACCLALLSCEQQGGEEATPKDELLDKTVWACSFFECNSGGLTMPEMTFSDALPERFDAAGIPYQMWEDTIDVYDTLSNYRYEIKSSLEFDKGQCVFTKDSTNYTSIAHYQYEVVKYSLTEGTWTDNKMGIAYRIDRDHIYYSILGYPEYEYTCALLTDFVYTSIVKTAHLNTTEQLSINPKTQNLTFTRSGDEVIMKNEKLKWIGMIDRDEWTMTVTQIVPSHKDIGTYGLK